MVKNNFDKERVANNKYFIVSDRLGFGIWKRCDLKNATELWGNSKITKYITASGKMSSSDIEKRLIKEIETYKENKVQYWPIFIKATGENVGVCGLHPYNIKNKIFEMGVHLKEEYWGRGIAMEACILVMKYAFKEVKAKEIFVGHNPKNTASEKLIKKLGFTYIKDEFYKPTGLYHPSYIISYKEFINLTNG
ncbi:GNAT family N-acetyltransferase [Clostridium felsineum]|uniref:Uncharacterized protein n=1 Tax=Clostridium felsineum TaxID=36839 RepID=A0A1S8LBF5_9CLOT|nr:GNAT family N-acetyltransferase [Clostridium felsineum]URZ06932.1 hypothetical protein CLROS_022650 [Clostridium felsineum]URZ11964.1 hypothetical protein CROST_026810 [Clostridium felsineum]